MKPQQLRLTGTVFGPVNLTLQDGPPVAGTLVGYVDHGDGRLQCSIWNDGRWCSRGLKPLSREVVAWYRMERLDGSPIF